MLDAGKKSRGASGFFGGTFALIWLVGWTVCTLAGSAIWVTTMVWQAGTSSYVSTEGTITSSRVETQSDSEGTSYEAKVSYDYEAGGQVFHGNRISYATRFTSGRKAAAEIVRRHPVGKRVKVYYSPAKPAAAVLEPGIRGTDFFMPLFLLPFNLIAIGGWYAVFVSRRAGVRPPGLSIKDDGLKVVARLYNVRPITAAGVALLVASFVLMFVCAFEIIPAPSDWVVGGAWCAALAVAAGAYAMFRQPRTRLEYDPLSGRIAIVEADGQQRAFQSSEVVRVSVHESRGSQRGAPERHDDDGQRLPNFSPIVTYRDAQQVERTIQLANWSSQEAAEWTASWLRRKLRLPG